MELFDVYSIYDIEPVKGIGSHVFTADGTDYLDFYGGHAVISIGHSHPRYVKAISEQVANFGFYSNYVTNSLQKELADKLGKISGYADYTLFLCNSGAEAIENALKVASFSTGRKKILAMEKAFHGRTSGAVSATDYPKMRSEFNKTDNVDFIPVNDSEAALKALKSKEYAAVIIEGIQGVAGINVPEDSFMRDLRNFSAATGTLMIVDEIQSGYGRTGRFFAHQYAGIKPDIITCAKGIANGFPCAGVIISPQINAFKGMLGTTFGGNHLACAAANAVIDVMQSENLMANAAELGDYLIKGLADIPQVKNLRGRGLMIGFEAEGFTGPELRRKLLFEQKVFTGGAGEYTVRLLPPLCITKDDCDRFLDALKKAISSN